jgi:hypothetical protein
VIATQRNRRLRDLIQPLPVRSPVRLGTKTTPYAAEFSVEPRKCAAETDWVAERMGFEPAVCFRNYLFDSKTYGDTGTHER